MCVDKEGTWGFFRVEEGDVTTFAPGTKQVRDKEMKEHDKAKESMKSHPEGSG